MEEVLIFACQLVAELFINVPWDICLYGRDQDNSRSKAWLGFFSLLAGAGLAGLSLWFFPDVVARHAGWRITLLLCGPLVSGVTAYGFARWKIRRRPEISPWWHFWCSWFFSTGYMLVRFAYATRP